MARMESFVVGFSKFIILILILIVISPRPRFDFVFDYDQNYDVLCPTDLCSLFSPSDL